MHIGKYMKSHGELQQKKTCVHTLFLSSNFPIRNRIINNRITIIHFFQYIHVLTVSESVNVGYWYAYMTKKKMKSHKTYQKKINVCTYTFLGQQPKAHDESMFYRHCRPISDMISLFLDRALNLRFDGSYICCISLIFHTIPINKKKTYSHIHYLCSSNSSFDGFYILFI